MGPPELLIILVMFLVFALPVAIIVLVVRRGAASGPSRPVPVAGASWQPDPTGRHELRYWNGAAWTEHVRSGDTTGIDPMDA